MVIFLLCPDNLVSEYSSGEGIPDLLLVLAKLTEKTMVENLTYRNEVQV